MSARGADQLLEAGHDPPPVGSEVGFELVLGGERFLVIGVVRWVRDERAASSGAPVGAAELRRKRLHTRGAVAVAHQGNPALADSQIYVTLENRPDLNNRYAVFGHLVSGDDVPARLERGDLIRRMYVKE